MKTRRAGLNQAGEINILAVPLVLMTVLFIAAAAFGYWAFNGRQDYKNNSDKKVAVAVEEAKRTEGILKDQAFAEEAKKPLEPYDGPAAYGSIHVEFPKTWSVYVHSTSSVNQPLNAYFNFKSVPSVQDQTSVFALRIQVAQQAYTQLVNNYASAVKSGAVTVTPYSLPKVPQAVGVRVDGLITPGKKNTGSMIIMPLRDKSIQIWTENAQQMADFNNIILPNLTFLP
jgi:hypothetical protein